VRQRGKEAYKLKLTNKNDKDCNGLESGKQVVGPISAQTLVGWRLGECGDKFIGVCTEANSVMGAEAADLTVPEHTDAIHSMILHDRRVSAKKIAQTLAISRDRVGCIVDRILYPRKLSAKWFPNVSVLNGSAIECVPPIPIWTDFCGIVWDFLPVS
jgi:hypothetical protein